MKVTANKILQACALYHSVTIEQLKSRTRKAHVRQARQMYMYIARQYTGMSFAEIAKKVGRDHATVMHACRKYGDYMDQEERNAYQAIMGLLFPSWDDKFYEMYARLGYCKTQSKRLEFVVEFDKLGKNK